MTDSSKGRPQMTARLDLGDKYSYLCLIDTQSGAGARGEPALCITRWSSVFTTPAFRFLAVLTSDGSEEVELMRA